MSAPATGSAGSATAHVGPLCPAFAHDARLRICMIRRTSGCAGRGCRPAERRRGMPNRARRFRRFGTMLGRDCRTVASAGTPRLNTPCYNTRHAGNKRTETRKTVLRKPGTAARAAVRLERIQRAENGRAKIRELAGKPRAETRKDVLRKPGTAARAAVRLHPRAKDGRIATCRNAGKPRAETRKDVLRKPGTAARAAVRLPPRAKDGQAEAS